MDEGALPDAGNQQLRQRQEQFSQNQQGIPGASRAIRDSAGSLPRVAEEDEENVAPRGTNMADSGDHGFVMVQPPVLPPHQRQSDRAGSRTPQSTPTLSRKEMPTTPIQMRRQAPAPPSSPARQAPQAGRPLPVPSQKEAYAKMLEHERMKKRQSLHNAEARVDNATRPTSDPVPTPAALIRPPSVADMSPPERDVKFVVGTPPGGAAAMARRKSSNTTLYGHACSPSRRVQPSNSTGSFVNRFAEFVPGPDDDKETSPDEFSKPLKLPFASRPSHPDFDQSQEMESVIDDLPKAASVTPVASFAQGAGAAVVSTASGDSHGEAIAGAMRRVNSSTQSSGGLSPAFPVTFELPGDLKPETMLDKEHNETLARLQYVLQLVECLVAMAKAKASPLSTILQSRRLPGVDTSMQLSEAFRRAEQLVIYVRALHMLSSALQLAQQQVAIKRLHPSDAVKQVLNGLNEQYHTCLARSQELSSLGIPSGMGVEPKSNVITVERLMYNHALELSQQAALDELFGNAHLCCQRYQMAYIMLHCLQQQVTNDEDRLLLLKYKNAVDKRLRLLEDQGFASTAPTTQ